MEREVKFMSSFVKIVSAGDLAPLRHVTDCQKDVNRVWDFFKQSDVGIVNLELPLTTSEERADKAITLKADPSISFSLRDVGLDVVSLANNHAGDFGSKGLLETIDALGEANVAVVGAGNNLQEAFSPVIQEMSGMKIAHIGICTALPTGYAAGENKPGVAPVRAKSRFYIDSITLDEQPGMAPWVETAVVEDDLNHACDIISKIKEDVDLVIAQVHWGVPNGWAALFQGPLADYQRPMAHRLIDAGVDVIMGHHPHVVHGVETYNNGIIVYSLGNFLFHSMSEDHVKHLTTKYPPYQLESLETGEALDGVVMETDLKDGKLHSIQFHPIRMNRKGEPEFISGHQARDVLERMKKHSNELNSDILIEDEIGKVVI